MADRNIQWDGWEIGERIGMGGFGAVYEIQRTIRGRTERAALKLITIPKDESEIARLRSDGYDDESITQYFTDSLDKIETEYAMMADMKGHSNIVYCDDIRTIQHDDGFGWDIYIKMELLTPLKGYMGKNPAEEQVIKMGIDICSALMLCEQLNVVHRDIKPDNILVSRNGTYKLGDFGIAKTMEKTTGGTITGTYDYMAPEVYNNRPYHRNVDIYSLGLVMYWLLNERMGPFLPLNGKRPTPSMKQAAWERRFSGESIPMPKYGSDALKKIVLKACAFDSKDRFQSAQEMLNALVQLKNASLAAENTQKIETNTSVGGKLDSKENAEGENDGTLTVGPMWGSSDMVLAEDIPDAKNGDSAKGEVAPETVIIGHNDSKSTVESVCATDGNESDAVADGSNMDEENDETEGPIFSPEEKEETVEEKDKEAAVFEVGEEQVANESQQVVGEKSPKEKDKKRILICLALMILPFLMILVFKTGWKATESGQYIYYKFGIPAKGWETLSGKQYYFDENGIMKTGFKVIDGKKYYFGDTDGIMRTGWQTILGNSYYFGTTDGIMRTGWQKIDGNRYYFLPSGCLQEGWLHIGNEFYYCNPDERGAVAVGKWKIGEDYYYFKDNGIMVTGEVQIGNQTYVFDENGHFQYREKVTQFISTTASKASANFSNSAGGTTRSTYQELNTPIENCSSLTIDLSVTEVKYGKCDGKWQIHVRTLSGKWKRIGYFTVKEGKGQLEIQLESPISFDAFTCTYYQARTWSGSFSQVLKNVKSQDDSFGTDVQGEKAS